MGGTFLQPCWRRLGAALMAAAAGLSGPVQAAATAKVVVNGQTILELNSTGMSFTSFGGGFTLQPGETLVRDYAWSVFASDDGRPVAPSFDEAFANARSCLPIHQLVCGPAFTGFEQIKAVLFLDQIDGRIPQPPGAFDVQVTGQTFIELLTTADPSADSWTRTGHTVLQVTNTATEPLRWLGQDLVAAFGYVGDAAGGPSPVPEPNTYVLMVIGLALMAAARRAQANI